MNGTMKKLLRMGIVLAALPMSWMATNAEGTCNGCNGRVYHGNDFWFTAGIRADYITSNQYAISAQGERLFSRYLRERKLNFYTVTANMRYEFGEECLYEYTWANHFFFRGMGGLGWLGSGRYEDHVTDARGTTQLVQARTHKGRVVDFQAGLGYMGVVCSPWLRMGPIVGWSYNLQKVSNRNAKISFSNLRPDNIFRFRQGDGDHFRTRWRGPFIGWDVLYHACQWNFEFGYEFHYQKLHAFWKKNCPGVKIPSNCPKKMRKHRVCDGFFLEHHRPPPGYFSQVIKTNSGFQNVVWARFIWNLFDNFTTGFSGNYKECRTFSGHVKPFRGGFAQVGEPDIFEYKLRRVVWRTGEFQLDLGYHW